MEQSSSIVEEEDAVTMMNVQEVARMSEWLRTRGISDTEIINCLIYIATGLGLPTKKPQEEKESE